jgi:hypothetical protein
VTRSSYQAISPFGMRFTVRLVLGVVAALGLAACSSSPSSNNTGTGTSTTSSTLPPLPPLTVGASFKASNAKAYAASATFSFGAPTSVSKSGVNLQALDSCIPNIEVADAVVVPGTETTTSLSKKGYDVTIGYTDAQQSPAIAVIVQNPEVGVVPGGSNLVASAVCLTPGGPAGGGEAVVQAFNGAPSAAGNFVQVASPGDGRHTSTMRLWYVFPDVVSATHPAIDPNLLATHFIKLFVQLQPEQGLEGTTSGRAVGPQVMTCPRTGGEAIFSFIIRPDGPLVQPRSGGRCKPGPVSFSF